MAHMHQDSARWCHSRPGGPPSAGLSVSSLHPPAAKSSEKTEMLRSIQYSVLLPHWYVIKLAFTREQQKESWQNGGAILENA